MRNLYTRIATGSTQADYAVFTLTFVVFVLLFFDVLLKSLGQSNYMPFYFGLDLVALVSFIPDVAWWAADANLLAGTRMLLCPARCAVCGSDAHAVHLSCTLRLRF